MSSVTCCEICGDIINYKNKNNYYNNKIKIDDFVYRISIKTERDTLFKKMMSRIFFSSKEINILISLCSKCTLTLLDKMITQEDEI